MELRRVVEVDAERDHVVALIARDETLLSLFPGRTEIVASEGDRRTTRTHYTALGREGDATFHFEFMMDGSVRFEKECDGRIWRELAGTVEVEETPDALGSLITIAMWGATKGLVPEFTIKGPMEDQIAQMSEALCAIAEGRG